MKLVAEYNQLELDQLLSSVEARLTQLTILRHSCQRQYGRGSQLTIDAGRAVATINCLLDKLRPDVAQAKLNPQSSHGTYEGSLQVGDEMPLVYGRPRASKVGQRR